VKPQGYFSQKEIVSMYDVTQSKVVTVIGTCNKVPWFNSGLKNEEKLTVSSAG
jgi:hypothetical protein